jgi:hypothetical protein
MLGALVCLQLVRSPSPCQISFSPNLLSVAYVITLAVILMEGHDATEKGDGDVGESSDRVVRCPAKQ